MSRRRISVLAITAALAACVLSGSAGAAPGTQDLRSPDARDAAEHMGMDDTEVLPSQDLRSPDARDAARDLPPVSTAATDPVADVAASEGGFDWGDAGIGAAMTLALLGIAGGSLLLVTGRRRSRFRAAH